MSRRLNLAPTVRTARGVIETLEPRRLLTSVSDAFVDVSGADHELAFEFDADGRRVSVRTTSASST